MLGHLGLRVSCLGFGRFGVIRVFRAQVLGGLGLVGVFRAQGLGGFGAFRVFRAQGLRLRVYEACFLFFKRF